MRARSHPSQPLTVAAIQCAAGDSLARNIRRTERLLNACRGADLIVLPEVFSLRGGDTLYRDNARPIPGDLTDWLAAQARGVNGWILAGSLIEKARGRCYNTALLFDRNGRIAARYRKIHLFEAHLENGRIVREKDVYRAGDRPVLVSIDGWKCGLAICYDLRFPELFRHYSARGAHFLAIPSNFTQRTGKDHWHTLVRARAIENQAFVVAPNQYGANPATQIRSYGHSLIVGPWGEILAEAGTGETILTASFSPDELRATRHRIPALLHRRMG